MKKWAYYNENEPAAAHVLRELIKGGFIAPGDVDERSISDVQPEDVRGFAQQHYFAGAGLWSVALRLAGWEDGREIATGSCPCQPFSVAGKGAGKDDKRHLWPDFFRLIEACRPAVVMGEQVSGSAGYDWFDGVAADLERANYAARALDIPACAVDAPHIRQRLYWCGVALGDPYNPRPQGHGRPITLYDAEGRQEPVRCSPEAGVCGVGQADAYSEHGAEPDIGEERGQPAPCGDHAARFSVDGSPRDMEHAPRIGRGEGWTKHEVRGGRPASTGASGSDMADAESIGWGRRAHDEDSWRRELAFADTCKGSFWHRAEWRTGADHKTRRTQPGVRLLVDGLAGRVHALRLAGNSIVPQVAAEVVAALMEAL